MCLGLISVGERPTRFASRQFSLKFHLGQPRAQERSQAIDPQKLIFNSEVLACRHSQWINAKSKNHSSLRVFFIYLLCQITAQFGTIFEWLTPLNRCQVDQSDLMCKTVTTVSTVGY